MKKLLSVFILLSLILSACEDAKTKQKATSPDQKLKVFTVNYPLYYFAERIGGEYIELIYPIPNDVDPAYWVPRELEEIQAVDLILANGADYAKWMEKVSLPSSKIVNTSKHSEDKYIKIEEGTSHSHGATGEHVHYGYAFTTWLDFKIAAGQAEAIKNVFIEKLPKHNAAISKNFDELKSELTALDRSMVSIGDMLKEKTVFVSHPVYQYMGKAYNIDIISKHWEPGEKPDDKQWQDFKHNLDHHPSNLMLWEGEPSDEITSSLMESGVKSIVFSPCANTPSEGDFMSVMNNNINRIRTLIK
jgi:zinc transport system substrate-binding protein